MKWWIDHVPPAQADSKLTELYDRTAKDGPTDHILMAHSLVPGALDSLLIFYKKVMHGRNDLLGGTPPSVRCIQREPQEKMLGEHLSVAVV